MNRRPGVTLIEVLAAIFITGIGLMALLTLFPLGALSMAQAVKDDRTGHAHANAQAVANAPLWVDNSTNPPSYLPLRGDRLLIQTMQGPVLNNGVIVLPAINNPNSPGYPVFVDPIGQLAYQNTNAQRWVAGQVGGVPRRTPSFLFGQPVAGVLPWTCLLDDLGFNVDGDFQGLPSVVVGSGALQRQLKYSWAWLLRMPSSGNPSQIELDVVVFSGRPLDGAGLTAALEPGGEAAFAALFAPGGQTVVLSWQPGQEPPAIRTGSWIFDATMPPLAPTPHGWFYRVVGVTDTGNNTLTVEVQVPFRGNFNLDPNTGLGLGQVVVIDNVAEVFENLY